MEQWFIASKRADFNKIAADFHISPVLARLLRNRDLITEEDIRIYLHGSLSDLPSPYLMKDIEKAAHIMRQKIDQGARIRIISDYDVDGVSSNYILWKGLTRCGARVDYRIPDRIEDGYGINEHLISQAYEDGIDTIITCDNGIAAIEQIAYARKLGMTVVVTDHHEVPYDASDGEITYHLPDADAVVNPKRQDCCYPYKNICGAVVCYKLIEIIYELYGIDKTEMEAFLPMAALATVCDVMPLKGENRIIVREGLARMPHTEIRGLQALMEANHLSDKKISAYHLGFILGPCINASGRLKTAREAMELLICQEHSQALQKAYDLVEINKERKDMTKRGAEAALQYLEESGHSRDKVLVVFLPDCHESIAGIIAGRVKEHYNKPVFVLTRSKDGVKGSGRSIEAYSMYDEMTKIKDIFLKYGGHPMAAGLSLQEDRIEEFRERLNRNTLLREEDFVKKISIDIAVPIAYLSENFIEELSLIEPYGNENKKPLFAQKRLKLHSLRVLGNSGRCIKLYVSDEGGTGMEALYFGESDRFMQDIEDCYDKETLNRLMQGLPVRVYMTAAYYPQVNEWRGRRTIQIVIEHYRYEV